VEASLPSEASPLPLSDASLVLLSDASLTLLSEASMPASIRWDPSEASPPLSEASLLLSAASLTLLSEASLLLLSAASLTLLSEASPLSEAPASASVLLSEASPLSEASGAVVSGPESVGVEEPVSSEEQPVTTTPPRIIAPATPTIEIAAANLSLAMFR
jgi:hypothetical protein